MGAVRAGLKEQSSLLLPNIHMDSSEARAASQRHGSLLTGGAPGGASGATFGGRSSPAHTNWRQEAGDTSQGLMGGNHTWRPSLELGPSPISPRPNSSHGEMLATLKEG